jgi:hypothetical protein
MSEVARRCLKCYGRPPLRDTILLPDQAQLPGRKYLDWHTQAAGPGRHVITRQRDRVWLPPLPASTSVMPAPGRKLPDNEPTQPVRHS